MNNSPHYPQRVCDDLCFRELTVLRIEYISAGFQCIVLDGKALNGFISCSFGNHSELFFPQSGTHLVPPAVTEGGIVRPEGPRPPSCDYISLHDELRHKLVVDFFIHGGGVASGWAMQTKPGDKLMVAGPCGSLVVPKDHTYQLYICDGLGMFAPRCHLETLSRLVVKPRVGALVSVWDNTCQDYLVRLDSFNIEWLAHGKQAVDTRLAQMQIPADDYFIWITGEGKVVKDLSRRFEAEQYDSQRAHVAAYWHTKQLIYKKKKADNFLLTFTISGGPCWI